MAIVATMRSSLVQRVSVLIGWPFLSIIEDPGPCVLLPFAMHLRIMQMRFSTVLVSRFLPLGLGLASIFF